MHKTELDVIHGISTILDNYDGFIIDLWGVVYDIGGTFPYVYPCLEHLKKTGKKVFFLSNSPREHASVSDTLQNKFNIPKDLYHELYTSGDNLVENFLKAHLLKHRNMGHRCFCIDTIPNEDFLTSLDLIKTSDLAKADFILVLDMLETDDGMKNYHDLIHHALRRSIPMICANPDKVILKNDIGEQLHKPGELALKYQKLGGEVHLYGKPHIQMFQHAIKSLAPIPSSRILMIGDTLATDIVGANNVHIDSAFVMSGIHSHEIVDDIAHIDLEAVKSPLSALFKRQGTYPTYCLTRFSL